MRLNKKLFITLVILLFPIMIIGQNSYSLNDSVKLKGLGVSTFGNDIKFNNAEDEFYEPLADCSNGEYHLYSLEDSLYLQILSFMKMVLLKNRTDQIQKIGISTSDYFEI